MIAQLQAVALRVQLPLVVFTVPLVLVLLAVPLLPVAVEIALDGQAEGIVREAIRAVRVVTWLLVGCVVVASAGAAMVLRVSLGSAVDGIAAATAAIAAGDFRHRIGSARVDELGQLAATIDAMAERLERMEATRRTLLAGVSHELRTPLTIIAGHAFTAARGEADPARRARLELVQEEARRLGVLVGDLLAASSLSAGSISLAPEPLDLRPLVRSAVARFGGLADEQGVVVRVDAGRRPVLVEGDAARLDQVLCNLLANAIRHAPRDTGVEVAVGVRGGSCTVDVANVGAPIPEALAASIFEPFVQGQARRGSLGLGLSIASGLVAAHGGSLVLAERGTSGRIRFRCSLPLLRGAAGHRQRSAAAASGWRPGAVMVGGEA